MRRLIIGLTGAFGSGATFIATQFLEKKGYKKCSLSDILREENKNQGGDSSPSRKELQEFGNKVRRDNPAYLAQVLDAKVLSNDADSNFVIDSIRNPAEIKYFRDKYPEFILMGLFADYEKRWDRVKASYNNSKDSFDADEQKDKGALEPPYGQRISDCFFESDLIIINNDPIICNDDNSNYINMNQKIDAYLKALQDPTKSNPTLKETLMAAAYTSGRRSKCYKRKVGAVIADKYDRIISSGFNGVPIGLEECKNKYGQCYRDIRREAIGKQISNELELDPNKEDDARQAIKKNVKLLEQCRVLHGEESAILNLVGRGVDLTDSTMYVTTFPCNLCANKIVQAGISKVVYFEPYPVVEAKEIFEDAHVKTEPFEGVTFRAFFKFYQYDET